MEKEEYINLKELAKQLGPNETIISLFLNEDSNWKLIKGYKEGYVSWIFQDKEYNALKGLLEVNQEKAMFIEDVEIDNVILSRCNNSLIEYNLKIKDTSNVITTNELQKVFILMKKKEKEFI